MLTTLIRKPADIREALKAHKSRAEAQAAVAETLREIQVERAAVEAAFRRIIEVEFPEGSTV